MDQDQPSPKPARRRAARPKAAAVAPEALGPLHSANWPATRPVMRPRSELRAYDRNARQHDEAQIAQIARSMEEFGFTVPILVDEDGQVLAGHGRLLAAAVAGIDTVPTIEARGWSEEQKRAYVIADNQLALNATWDVDLLHAELRDLSGSDFDLGLVGFDAGALSVMLNPPATAEADPEEAPDPPAVPVSALGDVWVLGNHRLTCGDSTDPAAVARVLDGAKPHLMVTDPPYGVEYDAAWRNKAAAEGKIGQRGQSKAIGKVENDHQCDWRRSWDLFEGDVAYVWCASLHAHEVADSLIYSGFNLKTLLIWAKDRMQLSRGDYHWQHEPCWYATRRKSHWIGGRKQTSIWDIKLPWDNYGNRKPERGDEKNAHSTQKPIECMKRPIENNSVPGDHVYEPFSGSGTTIIAGEMTGRWVHAIELSPAYVDVAVRRWEAFTGREAILEGSGDTFARVAAARLGTEEPTDG